MDAGYNDVTAPVSRHDAGLSSQGESKEIHIINFQFPKIVFLINVPVLYPDLNQPIAPKIIAFQNILSLIIGPVTRTAAPELS